MQCELPVLIGGGWLPVDGFVAVARCLLKPAFGEKALEGAGDWLGAPRRK